MARQTSKNRWVAGKRTLCYSPNYSEFAGGSEMGTAIAMGYFTVKEAGKLVNWPDSERVLRVEAYNEYEKAQLINCFLNHGHLIVS